MGFYQTLEQCGKSDIADRHDTDGQEDKNCNANPHDLPPL